MGKKFSVYFEIYGHKIKANITASSEAEAKRKIVSKLKFNKVVELKDEASDETYKHYDSMVNHLAKMLGITL